LYEELNISIAMGNAQWTRGIMLFEADVGTDEHTTLFSITIAASLLKGQMVSLPYQTDPEE